MSTKGKDTPSRKGYWKETLAVIAILAAAAAFFALYSRLNSMETRIRRAEDVQAIERLQYAYNYYVEHMLKQEIIDCFSDSPNVVLDWLEGKWKGKEGVRRYFDVDRVPPVNFQHQLMPISGLITVAPNGKTARGRWYAFGGVVMPSEKDEDGKQTISRSFINGVYEIGYVKENNIWKILTVRWLIPYGVRIYDGWIAPEDIAAPLLEGRTEPGGPFPEPDVPMDPNDLRYVTGYILPYHFKHPVTGKPTSEAARNDRLTPLELEGKEP